MATSPNFNWPEPDNTDLVKNGALAIRTAVDAIDSSMVDLKGGTTGQVLAKATNTDMDFSWVAAASSPLTTKGDLYGYSTANARVAVGTNGQLLSADSTAATGVSWSYGGKNTAYTPTWGVESGTAPTLGNGSLTGFYTRVGDLVFFQIGLVFGSTTTAGVGTYTFGLPFAMSNSAKGITGSTQVLDTGVAWYRGYTPVTVQGGFTDKFTLLSNAGVGVSNSAPISFATGDTIYAWGVYSV
jgi:hypothetical protein